MPALSRIRILSCAYSPLLSGVPHFFRQRKRQTCRQKIDFSFPFSDKKTIQIKSCIDTPYCHCYFLRMRSRKITLKLEDFSTLTEALEVARARCNLRLHDLIPRQSYDEDSGSYHSNGQENSDRLATCAFFCATDMIHDQLDKLYAICDQARAGYMSSADIAEIQFEIYDSLVQFLFDMHDRDFSREAADWYESDGHYEAGEKDALITNYIESAKKNWQKKINRLIQKL